MPSLQFINPEKGQPATSVLCLHQAQAGCYRAKLCHASVKDVFQAASATARKPHIHDVYHLVLITKGTGTVHLQGSLVNVSAGDLLISSPLQAHDFINSPGEDKEYSQVTFELIHEDGHSLQLPFHELLATWSGSECGRGERQVLSVEQTHLLQQFMETLVVCGMERKAGYEVAMMGELVKILNFLYQHLYAAEPSPLGRRPMQLIREYLLTHYAKKITLEDLSRFTGLSANHISRSYRRLYGCGPIQALQQVRIHSAESMLKNTEIPIKTIAPLVGYDDLYFFSKCFKKLTGIAPGKYRRQFQSTG